MTSSNLTIVADDTARRLAVFDVDGTLVDSLATIVAAMASAWRGEGLTPPAPDRIHHTIGLPLAEAVGLLAPAVSRATHARLVASYRQASLALYARPDHTDALYPGAREVLTTLAAAGVLLGIATGKGVPGLHATIGKHDLIAAFVTLQTGDRARGKPHPDMLERAMAETGVAACHVVMIGDTVYDIEMARNAGVAALGVAWGCHGADALRAAGAAAVIDDFAALPALFARLTRQAVG